MPCIRGATPNWEQWHSIRKLVGGAAQHNRGYTHQGRRRKLVERTGRYSKRVFDNVLTGIQCGGNTVGTFRINYDLSRGTIQGTPVTDVIVYKY